MKANILIVEDESDIAHVIKLYLKKENVDARWAQDGETALKMIGRERFDLIVLDINLPGMDGFETLREIRKFGSMPVIIVSARQEDVDMIMGFATGADDYVTKPFSPSVLIARIRAHLRRKDEHRSRDLILFGPWELDREHMILKRNGETMSLSPREMEILLFLSSHSGEAFSNEDLYREIWGNDFGDLSTVSVHIQRLRKKLEADPSHPEYIRTRYGYGYYFQGISHAAP